MRLGGRYVALFSARRRRRRCIALQLLPRPAVKLMVPLGDQFRRHNPGRWQEEGIEFPVLAMRLKYVYLQKMRRKVISTISPLASQNYSDFAHFRGCQDNLWPMS